MELDLNRTIPEAMLIFVSCWNNQNIRISFGFFIVSVDLQT
jgi:hypothetical protein